MMSNNYSNIAKACLNPRHARLLRPESKEYAYSLSSLKNLWHIIYDFAPSLLSLDPPDGKRLFESFLNWAEEERISFNWSIHSQILFWVHEFSSLKTRINNKICIELLRATAISWMRNNDETYMGIIVASSVFPGRGVLGKRSENPEKKSSFSLVQIPLDQSVPKMGGHIKIKAFEQTLMVETWQENPY